VTAVTLSNVPILAGKNRQRDVAAQGSKPTRHGQQLPLQQSRSAIRAGIPLIAGREFTDADVVGSPKVVIVNEAFTRKFNLGRDAVGKR
jgi:hypothetical protein